MAKMKELASAGAAQMAIFSDFRLKTNLSKPFEVLIEPTVRCPMACKFCDLPTDTTFPKSQELSIDRWKEILDELKAYLPVFKSVYIGGGEPFFRKDLIDLIEYSHAIGVGTRTLTIGVFCTPALLDRIIASPMHSLKFSLHSSREDVHNRLVGRDVYKKSTGAIRYLRENGYEASLGVLCTVYRENVDHLGEIARLGADLGLDYMLFRPLLEQTVADRRTNLLDRVKPEVLQVEDMDVLRKSIDELKELKAEGLPIVDTEEQLDAIADIAQGGIGSKYGCTRMYESIAIKPNGNVDACGNMALGVLGNVAENSVSEVLSSAQAWSVRHGISRRCQCTGNIFVRRTVMSKTSLVLDLLRS